MPPTAEHGALTTMLWHHLCDAWGWPRDEPEALRLAQNLVQAAPALVEGTRTPPESLFSALTGRDLTEPGVSSADHLFAATIGGVPQVTDLRAPQ